MILKYVETKLTKSANQLPPCVQVLFRPGFLVIMAMMATIVATSYAVFILLS